MSILSQAQFHSERAAFAYLESVVWPDGQPSCPHCGVVGHAKRMRGKATRLGLFKCYACREQFRVTVGTVFEHLRLPLHKALQAAFLLCSSKKGISAHQLHRTLGITYKSAWFLAHRIREAMTEINPGPLGGEGKTVEADETFIGNAKGSKTRKTFVTGEGWVTRGGGQEKYKVVSLVERGGSVRSVKVDYLTANAVREILVRNVSRKSKLMTDQSNVYTMVGAGFASHEAVNHSIYEWARGSVSTNTIEGAFSIFKRGMKGIYQHCGEQHLQRYLSEFDFRYNNRVKVGVDDEERAGKALKSIVGKRLTYGGSKAAQSTATL